MEELFGHPIAISVLGFAVGLIGTLIGAGGGFFVVPYLLLVFGFDPPRATATSLWLVLLNSISSTARNVLSPGKIQYRLGTILAAFTIPGALIGREIVQHVHPTPFQLSFAALLVAMAGYAAFFKPRKEGLDRPLSMTQYAVGAIVSFFTGFIASMFGIGGGLIHVPLMMFVLGLAAVGSVATSQFCLVFTSLAAVLYSLPKGQTDWRMVLLLAPGIVLGAQAGVWALQRVSAVTVRRVLAVICVLVAVELAIKALI